MARAWDVARRGGDLVLGGLVAADLADHIGHRHLPAVEILLLVAPVGAAAAGSPCIPSRAAWAVPAKATASAAAVPNIAASLVLVLAMEQG
ncbi:MAG: hypothetical protein ACXVX4_15190 [Mycobacterium sp.]